MTLIPFRGSITSPLADQQKEKARIREARIITPTGKFTGYNATDVQFTGAGRFHFAVSIHDDADSDEHAHTGRDVLRLRFP